MSANKRRSIIIRGLISDKDIDRKYFDNFNIMPTSKRAAAKALKKKKKRK